MVENLFILGAGASKDCGAPLMNNFLDVADDLLRAGQFDHVKEEIESVFRLKSELGYLYNKSNMDIHNIESLFGAIEMGRIIDRLVEHEGKSIENLRSNLISLIVQTLEESILLVRQENDLPSLKGSYHMFVDYIEELGYDKCSIITFNYDLALDYALYKKEYGINYGFSQEGGKNIQLLKLHGSTNWALNAENQIKPIYFHEFKRYPDIPYKKVSGLNNFTIQIGTRINEFAEIIFKESGFKNVPLIVPPTWNKNMYHGDLSLVWKKAAEALRNARNIYVIGYSLPESDAFFRYLFALGTLSKEEIKKFWVYDPNNDGTVKSRFEKLVGNGIRHRFKYYSMTFNEMLYKVRGIPRL